MIHRQYEGNSPLRHRFILVSVLLIWIWGCAAHELRPPKKRWTCDNAADAAVTRQDWDQALRGHQALLEKMPGNCLAVYHLGYIQGKLGDRDAEVSLYEKAVRCGFDGDDRLFFNLGMAYGEMSRTQKALAAFERAVALDANNAEHYFGLGITAQAAGQTDRARSALRTAVRINPRHWEAHTYLARILLDQGDLAAARIHLDVLRAGVPNDEEVVELWQIYEDRRITSYER